MTSSSANWLFFCTQETQALHSNSPKSAHAYFKPNFSLFNVIFCTWTVLRHLIMYVGGWARVFPPKKGQRKKKNYSDKKIQKTQRQNRINIQFEYISAAAAELKTSTETVIRSLCEVWKHNATLYTNSITSKVFEQLHKQSSITVLIVFSTCVCRLLIQRDVYIVCVYNQ